MEYLNFDYINVNREVTLANYYDFALNNKHFKYYAFDLFLSQYDSTLKQEDVKKSIKLTSIQKYLTIIPYILVFSAFLIKKQKDFFVFKNFEKEQNFVMKAFIFTTTYRLCQKAYLKYQGDTHIYNIYTNKKNI